MTTAEDLRRELRSMGTALRVASEIDDLTSDDVDTFLTFAVPTLARVANRIHALRWGRRRTEIAIALEEPIVERQAASIGGGK